MFYFLFVPESERQKGNRIAGSVQFICRFHRCQRCQRGGVTLTAKVTMKTVKQTSPACVHARARPEADAVLISVLVVKPFAAQIAAGVQTKGGRDAYIKGRIKTKASPDANSPRYQNQSKQAKTARNSSNFSLFLSVLHSQSIGSRNRPFHNQVHKMEVPELGGCALVHRQQTGSVIGTGMPFPWLLCVFIPHL